MRDAGGAREPGDDVQHCGAAVIEAGYGDPELREVAAGVAALAETQGMHMALLLLVEAAAKREPEEGEALHEVLARVALEAQTQALAGVTARLGRLGGEVEAAVAQGAQRAGEATR